MAGVLTASLVDVAPVNVSDAATRRSSSSESRKEYQRMATKAATATKLTPLHDRIVVRRVEEAETSRGGIIIPDSAKDKPQEGEVIAGGRGKTNDKGET